MNGQGRTLRVATRTPASDLERVGSWTGLADDALRRRAVAAANSRDVEELWGLVEAHTTAERGGPAGTPAAPTAPACGCSWRPGRA